MCCGRRAIPPFFLEVQSSLKDLYTSPENTRPSVPKYKGRLYIIGVFAMYRIVLGWKTYKYYCETDEPPNPRPTQPKKNRSKSGIYAPFSPRK